VDLEVKANLGHIVKLHLKKIPKWVGDQRLLTVVLATWEAEIRKIEVQNQSRQEVLESLS
jgi:hypothetical protein